jgi:hypothetical protein
MMPVHKSHRLTQYGTMVGQNTIPKTPAENNKTKNIHSPAWEKNRKMPCRKSASKAS